METRNTSLARLRNVPRDGSFLNSWAETWLSQSFCNDLSGAAMKALARAMDQPVFPGCRKENWAFYLESWLLNCNLIIQTYLSFFVSTAILRREEVFYLLTITFSNIINVFEAYWKELLFNQLTLELFFGMDLLEKYLVFIAERWRKSLLAKR